MLEWQKVYNSEIRSSVIRKESLSPLSITIKALGEIGNELYKSSPDNWIAKLTLLKSINWQKSNPDWQSGIVVNGSVQLSHATQQRMVAILKENECVGELWLQY